MKWRKVMAFSLAASMIAGQAVSAAPAAEAASESALQTQADSKSNTNASYTDPWTKTAVPNQAAKVTSDVDKTKFTHKEWTGETYTDVDGNQVKAADVYGINTEPASTFATTNVVYDSVDKAIKGAKDYDKAASKYVQFLTGKDQADWSLVVLQNQALAQGDAYKNFYKTDYKATTNDWKTNLQLPCSWTRQGFDFSIYTNVTMPWQSKYDSNVSAPNAPANYNPVGLYRKTFKVTDDMKAANGRVYLSFQGVESSYYVYVNGKEVGYSEDSYSPHSFDITDYLTTDGSDNVVVKDQSANGYDMDISGVSTADLAEKDGEIALKGYADVTGETADETFNSLIGGNKAFTIEAVFNPNNVGYSGADYNMIASKGDSSAAFRVSEQTAYFFIKNTNGSWKTVQVPLTSEEMNQWLHVAAVYDGNNISVYVEGKEMVTTQNVGSVDTTTYPLGIGYCPETQRLSSGYLKNIRVYSAALSKDDLDNGTYKADNEKTVLWYDFDNYSYNNIDTKATGVNVSTDALELKEEEGAQVSAAIAPYYAKGELTFASEDETIATVDDKGNVTAVKAGETKIKVSVKDSDVYAEIAVKVNGKPVVEKPITGVSVKADKSELKVGETAKLTAVITPEDTTDSKDLKYESSDKAVAEVSDAGVVTAKAAGKAVITVSSAARPDVKATVEITVKAKDKEPETKEPESETETKAPQTETKAPETEKPDVAKKVPAKGSVHKSADGKLAFRVTKSDAKNGTVTVSKLLKKTVKTVTIPATVTIDGYTFKVTAVANNVFKNASRLKSVVIGANVKSIGKSSFYKCKKLATITFKGIKAPGVGKNAFKSGKSKVTVKVPKKMKKSQLNKLKKALKKAGVKKASYKKTK